MVRETRQWPSLHVRLVGVFFVAAALAGCASDTSYQMANDNVNMVSVGDPGEVSATSLAKAMIRAGFSHDEILELGPDIRRAL